MSFAGKENADRHGTRRIRIASIQRILNRFTNKRAQIGVGGEKFALNGLPVFKPRAHTIEVPSGFHARTIYKSMRWLSRWGSMQTFCGDVYKSAADASTVHGTPDASRCEPRQAVRITLPKRNRPAASPAFPSLTLPTSFFLVTNRHKRQTRHDTWNWPSGRIFAAEVGGT